MNRQKEFKLSCDYIPIEIQGEIMKRLPLKPLLRFRSVSKPLDSLIRSSKFLRDYKAFHPEQPHHRLLIRYSSHGRNINHTETYVSIADDDMFPKKKLPMIIPMSVGRISKPIIVYGSHGLFCFYNIFSFPSLPQTMRAVIWNPTISKSVDIDLPVLDTSTSYKTVIGFGVCPRTSDPKLVKIMFPTGTDSISTHIEVFTMKSGLWRSPRSNLLPRKSIEFEHKQVVIDEFIYWLAHDGKPHSNKNHLIISFDMISEEFVELPLPVSVTKSFSRLCISKLKESLIVVETTRSSLLVWIMHNGDPKSFTQTYTINMPTSITTIRDVLGFRENGEPIFVSDTRFNEDELFVYEPNLQQINSTRIFGELKSFYVCSYAETLLLLDH